LIVAASFPYLVSGWRSLECLAISTLQIHDIDFTLQRVDIDRPWAGLLVHAGFFGEMQEKSLLQIVSADPSWECVAPASRLDLLAPGLRIRQLIFLNALVLENWLPTFCMGSQMAMPIEQRENRVRVDRNPAMNRSC
jgi:hypothetical protein